MTAQSRVKTIVAYVPSIILIVGLLAFIAWMVASTIFMIEATDAIRHTTLLCADRMTSAVEERAELLKVNSQLSDQNKYVNGRLSAFEMLYGISKQSYNKNIGGDK